MRNKAKKKNPEVEIKNWILNEKLEQNGKWN